MNIDLKKAIVYVARDIERALGMEPGLYGSAGYFVVSNDTAYGREVQKKHPQHVFLIDSTKLAGNTGELMDTYDLLMLPEVAEIVNRLSADVLVFQNTSRIERVCADRKWKLLNPSAAIAKRVEEKISQVEWLAEDGELLPRHNVSLAKEVRYIGKKFVAQFNHAHTGGGTFVIDSEEALQAIQEKFPNRECRITDFVDGPVFTVNAVVPDNAIESGETVVGNPSYQITGIAPFTDMPFSTIGNDWDLPRELGHEKAYRDVQSMARTIGARLASTGWKGLFGIDVVFDPVSKSSYLLEINARQPASTSFESQLQAASGVVGAAAPTIFQAHLMALLGKQSEQPTETMTPISGAQILKRVTEKKFSVDTAALRAKGLTVIEYPTANSANVNSELFRIQSSTGIMEAHNRFNDLGKFIHSCLR